MPAARSAGAVRLSHASGFSAAARSGFIVGTGYLANAGRRAAAACMASLDETTNRRLLAAVFRLIAFEWPRLS